MCHHLALLAHHRHSELERCRGQERWKMVPVRWRSGYLCTIRSQDTRGKQKQTRHCVSHVTEPPGGRTEVCGRFAEHETVRKEEQIGPRWPTPRAGFPLAGSRLSLKDFSSHHKSSQGGTRGPLWSGSACTLNWLPITSHSFLHSLFFRNLSGL